MHNRKEYLLKNTSIFALSNIATKFIYFFLIPLYTYKLTTSEYGVVDLLYTICSFLYPLLTLNISEAIFRFSMDKNYKSNKIVSIGLICMIFSIILGLLSFPILNLLRDYSIYSIYFYCYLVTLSISQILLVILKGQEKLKLFTIGNIINTVLIAIFSIIFLLVFDLGIPGYFLAYIVSNLVVSTYVLFYGNIFDDLKKFTYDRELFKAMTKYSVVLIPTSFMWWIINSSDRIMITKFISDSANGIYAISYKLPSLLTVIASIFNQAWTFSAVNEKDSKDSEQYTNAVFNRLFNSICIIAIILLAFIKPILSIFVESNYYVAWKYIPFLMFGFVFMTMSTFVSTSYNVYKDSKGFLFSGLFGAVINIILNFVFIPALGISGAALATAISYISVFIYRIFDTRKYRVIRFDSSYVFSIVILFLSCCTLYINSFIGIILHIVEIISILILNKNIIIEIISFIITIIRDKIFKKK